MNYMDSVYGHNSMASAAPSGIPRGDNAIVLSPPSPEHQNEFEAHSFRKPENFATFTSNPPCNTLLESRVPPLNPPSRNANALFFKTKLCQKFISGSCHFGSNCSFAHGDKELRRPPPNWQRIVAEEQGRSSDQQRMPKGGICRMFYYDGICTYGDKCIYLHVERERSIGGGLTAMAQIGLSGTTTNHSKSNEVFSFPQDDGSRPRPASFKTKPCFKWQSWGSCVYGENCNYAHIGAELEKKNAVEAPSRHIPTIRESPNQTDSAEGGHHVQDKGFMKLKRNSKIAGIYGDWLDEN
ncbi:zinc finger CCCH domain-containing protein 56-like isoform X2 [Typha angustifolia]|uniref:zinc finger CCCH domain-containing protein 56-like isoform X2 n=1 Tax=Typha angustifolia TaxID=59011 RepID=UPI003C2B3F79